MGISRHESWSGLPVASPNPCCVADTMCFLHINFRFSITFNYSLVTASQVARGVRNPPANAGDIRDAGLIPGSGRSPEGGHGNLLQYFAWRIPMDRGAWQATVHGVANRWPKTRLLMTLSGWLGEGDWQREQQWKKRWDSIFQTCLFCGIEQLTNLIIIWT